MNQLQLLTSDPSTGHMTSPQVTKTFIPTTSHRIDVEPWARCHCVCLVKTYRLICNIYDLPGSLIGPSYLTWPKVKFSYWPFRVKMHVFRCILTRVIRRELIVLPRYESILYRVVRDRKCELLYSRSFRAKNYDKTYSTVTYAIADSYFSLELV